MGKVVVQDGAVIPEAVKRQAEADDKAQEAEIKKRELAKVAQPVTEPELPLETPLPAIPPAPVAPPAPLQGPVAPVDTSVQLTEMQKQLALERQRNQTLQGRIDAIGPKSAEEIRVLRGEIAAMEKRLATPPAPTVAPQLAHLNAEEREVYAGGEIPVEAKMAQGMVEESAGRLRAELQAENANLRERLDVIEQGTAVDRQDHQTMTVMTEVEKLFPGATALNKDQGFIGWLESSDPRSVTGASYADRGNTAMQRGDSYAIAELMKEYQGQGTVIDPLIARQIRPEATTVTSPVIPVAPVTVKESEASAFFQDKARNRCMLDGVPMTKAQIEETEKIINLAIDEGRIVQG